MGRFSCGTPFKKGGNAKSSGIQMWAFVLLESRLKGKFK